MYFTKAEMQIIAVPPQKGKRHKLPRPVDNIAQLEADEQDAKKAKNTNTIRHINRLLHKKLLLLLNKALPIFGQGLLLFR